MCEKIVLARTSKKQNKMFKRTRYVQKKNCAVLLEGKQTY